MVSVPAWPPKAAAPFLPVVALKAASALLCKTKEVGVKSTVKSSADVSRIFSHGKRFSTPFATLIVLKDEKQHDHGFHGRVAFVAGKKLGNAVWRNSAKRRLRAIVHDLGGPWEGYDVVISARSPILRASYSKVSDACEKALVKAGLRDSASR